jgi:hypothetical protein
MNSVRDIEPKLGDLGHYLDPRVFGLSPNELKEVGQCYGHLIDFVSKLECVMSLPPPPPQNELPTSQLPLSFLEFNTSPTHLLCELFGFLTTLAGSLSFIRTGTSQTSPEVLNRPPTSSTSQNKRKQLLPPSPEQRQRHQSHTIHRFIVW